MRTPHSIVRLFLALAALLWASPAFAAWMSFATMPESGKAARQESLRMEPGRKQSRFLRLGEPDAGEIQAIRETNASSFNKRLQIGIGREVAGSPEALSRSLEWESLPEGMAAHWEVSSPGAHALRIGLAAQRLPEGTEIRFAGRKAPGTVYGPFSAGDIAAGGETYWSPVLEGESAIVEVVVPHSALPSDLALSVARVSHLFASPSERDVESLAKASQPCEVDLICRSANDAALASTGRSVARMTFSDGLGGGTYLCTGTLLNSSGGGLTPYFYSANHCMSTQPSANTLTTHWFYDRTGCGSGGTSASYVQVPGGAQLLYADAYSDALLLKLNNSPPPGAIFSGWDSAPLSIGTALTAVHHPAGDLKKVSLGTMGGFGSAFGSATNFVIANWNSTATGVTEGGSSGSGIFTAVGQPATEYRHRGGLYGGPSSCTATGSNLRDYYSRFDQVYPAIAQYLDSAPSACTYELLPTSVTVGAKAATGLVGVATSAGCSWSVSSNASWLSGSGGGNGNGTASYSVAENTGSARVGTLTIAGQSFTVTQQAPSSTGTNLLTNPGFESGGAGWSQSATGGYAIIYTDATVARSGSWFAWLGGYNSGTDTLYKFVTIPSDAGQVTLRFWYSISTEEASTTTAFDAMTVSIVNPVTGVRLATLATLSNRDKTSGWVQSPPYDVSAFRGQTVRLVFSATMDASELTSFLIDDVSLVATTSGSAANYTGLWYNSPADSEAGWGINFTHQGDVVFATLFTYDASGAPMWLVMPAGTRQADGVTFSGELGRTTGPAFNTVPFVWDASRNYAPVGTMSVTFNGTDSATLTYTFSGATVRKTIQKQVFGSRAANCSPATGSRDSLTNYQDLWYKAPAESEPGWGINVTHQGDILFATLFTYEYSGRDLWLVMAAGYRQSDGSYVGELYRTSGPAFNAVPFTPIGPADRTTVGTMRFQFTSGTTGTLTYSYNGVTVTKPITRQVFSTPVPACS